MAETTSGSHFNGPAASYGPDGSVRVNFSDADNSNTNNGNGNAGNSSSPGGNVTLVLNNGQMGYWVTEVNGGGKNDHLTRTFIPVGPSEAQKAAATAAELQAQQQASAAAIAAANKAAVDAAAAEQQRQYAIAAAAAAGQHLPVSTAQAILESATNESNRMQQVSTSAAQNAVYQRQLANAAEATAQQAEQYANQLNAKAASLTNEKGNYGNWVTEVNGGGKNDHLTRRFVIELYGSTLANSRTDAVNARNTANQINAQANAAEQYLTSVEVAAHDAESYRLAALAQLAAAQQAAAWAAEVERQRQIAEAAAAAAAEQQRQAQAAAQAAEAARIAAEREAVLESRQAVANKLKSTEIQSVRGIAAGSAPAAFPLVWSVASAGGVKLGSETTGAVWSRISTALAELRAVATASLTGPIAATIIGLLYSRDVGIGSDIVPGRDISAFMPGDAFSLPDDGTLNYSADGNIPLAMPVRGRLVEWADGTLETQLVLMPTAGLVPVVRAQKDSSTGYWGFTLPAMPGAPSQTILVSPADAPGADGTLTLTGPVPLPETILHTGGQLSTPESLTVTTSPVPDDVEFNDLILIFPSESGLKPLYVMLRNRRNIPGTVSGNGQQVGSNWLSNVSTGNGSPIPNQIADKLRGQTFNSFDAFRKDFWRAVADDPTLGPQFSLANRAAMRNGYSPATRKADRVGGRIKLEIHHETFISNGGSVYDVDNLRIMTPKRHIEVHQGDK